MATRHKAPTSGFVYIWRDRKRNRYYIGSHWGTEYDGYICSSFWMKQNYDSNPESFRRKILSRVTTTKADLLEEEHRWLGMIKKHELGRRYYNKRNERFGHWSTSVDLTKAVGERISVKLTGRKNGPPSEETKRKISEAQAGKPRKKHSEETKALMSAQRVGKKLPERSEEYREKLSRAAKARNSHLAMCSPESRAKAGRSQQGVSKSPESVERMKEAHAQKRAEGWNTRWAPGTTYAGIEQELRADYESGMTIGDIVAKWKLLGRQGTNESCRAAIVRAGGTLSSVGVGMPMTPHELETIVSMRASGATQDAIAKVLGRSRPFVTKQLAKLARASAV